jgi:hypothetical protein
MYYLLRLYSELNLYQDCNAGTLLLRVGLDRKNQREYAKRAIHALACMQGVKHVVEIVDKDTNYPIKKCIWQLIDPLEHAEVTYFSLS